jgi:hypothetical protein
MRLAESGLTTGRLPPKEHAPDTHGAKEVVTFPVGSLHLCS